MKKLTKDEIEFFLKEHNIKNFTINSDLTVDVNGSVDLSNKGLTAIPVSFRNIKGWFDVSNNQLTTLKGCPKNVGGNFDCSNNQLTTLEGCPVNLEMLDCSHNQLFNK